MVSRAVSKETLIKLAEARVAEARTLLASGHSSGAYYLAGYAVELRLKAIIAEKFQSGVIPDRKLVSRIFTHDLDELVDAAGLKDALAAASRTERAFAENWVVVRDWNEQSRYSVHDENAARSLLVAIEAPGSGILSWLTRHSST